MNTELLNLEPKIIWKNFRELTLIPRPSKKEEKIIDFMVNWAKERNLDVKTDKVQNVIVSKPASKGMENKKGLVLQAHLDMVPQKNSDKEHDFEKDPISAYIDGEWVTAEGTTLGADNGMGVAAAMAVLESEDLEHGPVEALFTIDEETGMTGAFNLEAGQLKGDILMNMDSEDEGELYIGCAGGADVTAEGTYQNEPVPANSKAFRLIVSGLKGGHSGMDIPLQRGNANKVLFRLLYSAREKFNIGLSEAEGGNMRNAIPREANALLTVPEKDAQSFKEEVANFNKMVQNELSETDSGVSIKVEDAELPKKQMKPEDADTLIYAVRASAHGTARFIDGMKEVPETSSNLAIVKAKDGKIFIAELVRSSVDSAKDDLAESLVSVFKLSGYQPKVSGEYPGWKPNFDSPILQTMKDVYDKTYGKVPEVKIIHAGLECGILGSTYPHWDMISFGPTIRFPHSPDEKVNIKTVEKFWNFLKETLKAVPEK